MQHQGKYHPIGDTGRGTVDSIQPTKKKSRMSCPRDSSFSPYFSINSLRIRLQTNSPVFSHQPWVRHIHLQTCIYTVYACS